MVCTEKEIRAEGCEIKSLNTGNDYKRSRNKKVPAPFATMCVAVHVSNDVHLYYEFFCEVGVSREFFFRDSISASFVASIRYSSFFAGIRISSHEIDRNKAAHLSMLYALSDSVANSICPKSATESVSLSLYSKESRINNG